jgi:hypothetical protein
MRLRRGTSPVLYDLYHGTRKIGRLCRAQHGSVVLWLDGFLTATDAASAASFAYSGRLAYEAQGAPAGSATKDANPTQSSPWAVGDSAGIAKLDVHPEGSAIHLRLGDVEIAQLHPVPESGGVATWSVRMPLANHDTPEVFLLAAARRMWEAVRRAGRGIRHNP